MTGSEIDEALESAPGWSLKDGRLEREFQFADFLTAIEFVNRLAGLAEAANHHPDIDIRYNRVLLGLWTHDAGGITRRDFDLAKRAAAAWGGSEG